MRHVGFQRIFLGCVKTAIHPLILLVKSFLFSASVQQGCSGTASGTLTLGLVP